MVDIPSENGPGKARFSNILKLNQKITIFLDLLCIYFLTYHRMVMGQFKKTTYNHKKRNYILLACCIYQLFLLILTCTTGYYVQLISYLVRPLVIIVFSKQVRDRSKEIFIFLKQAVAVLSAIFCFVLFSSILFYTLFKATYQGSSIFPDIETTYYQLLILLTTANFPDVMLPAYNIYYLSAWIFVVYFIIAFYFLFNILIASIFTMFAERLERKARDRI